MSGEWKILVWKSYCLGYFCRLLSDKSSELGETEFNELSNI